MFEVAGTQFEQGVFEIYLEKKLPAPLGWILAMGPVPARLLGIGMLAFSFFFSTSKAPTLYFVDRGLSSTPAEAFQLQQNIGYLFYFLAVTFYATVFLFRKETMQIAFNKGSKLFSVVREPAFRFMSAQRGHVPFSEIQPLAKVGAAESSDAAPHGKILIKSAKMPKGLQLVEFRVLSEEQFEFFPLNIERILGT